MAYPKTNWENLPSTSSPLTKASFNKIENELEKLDPTTPYTQATGTYTTAEWAPGTNNCVWTAPRTGLYIIWATFDINSDSASKVYKQFQFKGTATRIDGDLLFYQFGTSSSSAEESINKSILVFTTSKLIYAEEGQTIIPYIHTPEAGIEWTVKLTGLFLK